MERKQALRSLPPPLKLLIVIYDILILFHLTSALVRVWTGPGFAPSNIEEYYLGNEEEMKYPRGFKELLESWHVHGFATPTMIFLLSVPFSFTALSEKKKMAAITGAFASFVLELLSQWLTRLAHPAFAYLLALSGAGLAVSVLILAFPVIRECWPSSRT